VGTQAHTVENVSCQPQPALMRGLWAKAAILGTPTKIEREILLHRLGYTAGRALGAATTQTPDETKPTVYPNGDIT